MPGPVFQVESCCLAGWCVCPHLTHHRESTHRQVDASSASFYQGHWACTHLSPACYNEEVFPFLSKICPPTQGLDLTLLAYSKTFLSSFPLISSCPCLFMSACTGAPLAPVLEENLFWLHVLLRLLPGQCQLPWEHGLPLLHTLSTSPSLLINPFMWLPSPHFRQWS